MFNQRLQVEPDVIRVLQIFVSNLSNMLFSYLKFNMKIYYKFFRKLNIVTYHKHLRPDLPSNILIPFGKQYNPDSCTYL